MSLEYRDRVKETTATEGLGPYVLGGPVNGFQSFSAIGDGNTCFYAVTNGLDWEVGIGTFSLAGSTLERTSVTASSAGADPIDWPSGSKLIWLDFPAAAIVSFLTALGEREPTIASGSAGQYFRGDKSWADLNKAAVGLGNVDNTADANKSVNHAASAGTVPWTGVSSKPSTFPPSSHTHPWGEVTGKPSTFPPSAHSHAVRDLSTFNWSGQSGQPSWLVGSNNGVDFYVWNPSNFDVAVADSARAVAWGNVSGRPNTLAGYNITDRVQTGTNSNGRWIRFPSLDVQICTGSHDFSASGNGPYSYAASFSGSLEPNVFLEVNSLGGGPFLFHCNPDYSNFQAGCFDLSGARVAKTINYFAIGTY